MVASGTTNGSATPAAQDALADPKIQKKLGALKSQLREAVCSIVAPCDPGIHNAIIALFGRANNTSGFEMGNNVLTFARI
jgi:hypothetical protein